jgi:hypothetical protein
VTAGLYTCENDFCLSCPQSHSCDNTCNLPCATGGGGGGGPGGGKRRAQSVTDLLGGQAGDGNQASLLVPMGAFDTMACPLGQFVARVRSTMRMRSSAILLGQCVSGDAAI